MFNVSISQNQFFKIKNANYVFDTSKNLITIRKKSGEPIVEIIWIEKTNEILIMNKSTFAYCKKIENVMYLYEKGIALYCQKKDNHYGYFYLEEQV